MPRRGADLANFNPADNEVNSGERNKYKYDKIPPCGGFFTLFCAAMSLSSDLPAEKPSVNQFENARIADRDDKISDQELAPANPSAYESLDEAVILRKMDIRLIPMLSILYLLAFLDRGNIGNAKIEGLVEDLHMTGPEYNWTRMAPFSLMVSTNWLRPNLGDSDCVLLYLLRF